MELLSDIAGWAGTILIVLAYYLVSNKKVVPESRVYQLMNLTGAFLMGGHVLYRQAWPALGLQVVWAAIAVMALLKSKQQPQS